MKLVARSRFAKERRRLRSQALICPDPWSFRVLENVEHCRWRKEVSVQLGRISKYIFLVNYLRRYKKKKA